MMSAGLIPTAEAVDHPINWGDADPKVRGPVICTDLADPHRNAIGAHSGPYSIYRALAVAMGKVPTDHKPELTLTQPAFDIGPFPSWHKKNQIVTMDPFGATVVEHFGEMRKDGVYARPTIAITQAHIDVPEILPAMAAGRLKADGKILMADGKVIIGKAAIE